MITNDLRIAKYVAGLPETRLLVTGGELLGSVFTLVGEHAITFLGDYTANWAFLGADAIDPVAGITNMNTLEVPLKRAMITAAAATIVVADSSKLGRRALARIAGAELSSAAMSQLSKYSRPGNVAESREVLREVCSHNDPASSRSSSCRHRCVAA